MSSEGFGCMYLPSIAPQGPVTPSVVSAGMIGGTDQAVITGIGTGMLHCHVECRVLENLVTASLRFCLTVGFCAVSNKFMTQKIWHGYQSCGFTWP